MRTHPKRYVEAGISARRLKELQDFCAQYREYKRMLRRARAGIVDRRPSSGAWHAPDPTAGEALSLADHPAARRVKLIESCARAVADRELYAALLRSVTDGTRYEKLRPPCGERQFWYLRQSFYIELDRRLWNLG